MKLFFRTIGEGVPLIILHGLWGASENWLPIAHLLEDKFQVILPDVRNHGQSPHDEAMNYEVMSNDVIELVEDLKLPVPPQRDGGSHNRIIDFMANFDLSQLHSREEVKEAIQQHFRTERSQQLFLKNIKKTASGFEWKINHRVISKHFDEISGCPSSLPNSTYDKEILFIKGEQSNLITGRECLQKEFPAARLVELPQCGHWIHSEQPEKLAQAIKNFLIE